jgi:hypothetical protein
MELRFDSEFVAAAVIQIFSLKNRLAVGCECLLMSSSMADLAWTG